MESSQSSPLHGCSFASITALRVFVKRDKSPCPFKESESETVSQVMRVEDPEKIEEAKNGDRIKDGEE
jgi:hypothetical protein